MKKILASAISTVGFSVAATMHAYWAEGGNWPGNTRIELAQKVVGVNNFPSRSLTWAVAGLLAVPPVLVGLRLRRNTLAGARTRFDTLLTVGLSGVVVIMGLRGIGGMIASTIFMFAGKQSPFLPRNLLLYSPFCILLALTTAFIAKLK
jgi:hypothetical protein